LGSGWLRKHLLELTLPADGGTVVNAAVLVDGERALEARVRRTAEPGLKLQIEADDGTMYQTVICLDICDLTDYANPQAPAALLKTAMLCIGVVDLQDDTRTLQQQLVDTLGGDDAQGLEVITASRLPMGSGLGGSSVLSGALLHAIGVAVGRQYDRSSLVHAVLKLEQMLSSGGGWQDQVGGMYPGLKVCRSAAALPLKVEVDLLEISASTVGTLNDHLVLCYSGQARLARNLLQGVLRRWFGRLPEVVETVSSLVSNAEAIQPAVMNADVEKFGACVSAYWSQKKLMAGCGVEPTLVTRAFAAMAPLLCGHTMAGAGGGGFILLVTRKPNDTMALQAALDSVPECHTFSLHKCEIDVAGMTTTIG
jgi:fucokinase